VTDRTLSVPQHPEPNGWRAVWYAFLGPPYTIVVDNEVRSARWVRFGWRGCLMMLVILGTVGGALRWFLWAKMGLPWGFLLGYPVWTVASAWTEVGRQKTLWGLVRRIGQIRQDAVAALHGDQDNVIPLNPRTRNRAGNP